MTYPRVVSPQPPAPPPRRVRSDGDDAAAGDDDNAAGDDDDAAWSAYSHHARVVDATVAVALRLEVSQWR